MDNTRYRLTQRLLHWLIAVLVLGLLMVGSLLGNLGFEGLSDRVGLAITNQLYGYHKTFGILLLILMVLRLVLRRVFAPPPYQPPLHWLERSASLAVHGLLYLALISMPILGWLATAAGDYPVQFFDWTLPGLIGVDKALSETLFRLHAWLGWLILALVLAHVAGAIYHWRIKRDGVMRRMSLF